MARSQLTFYFLCIIAKQYVHIIISQLMSTKHYTPDQIEELLKNPYISKCSPKYITYTYACKEQALRLYETRKFSSREIWRSLGFPSYITESAIPKDSIKAWKKIVSEQWFIWLKESRRWRKKKEKPPWWENIPENETVEYLKAKIAYLEAENQVFALIRAWKYK